MKKAVIIGGSNGIGLAIGDVLIKRGFFIEICDRNAPEEGVLDADFYHFNFCELLEFDEELFKTLANDRSVEVVMITAGIGRVANFQAHHIAEIDKILAIDTVSTLKIIRLFYDRILLKDAFYAGVMVRWESNHAVPWKVFIQQIIPSCGICSFCLCCGKGSYSSICRICEH